MKIFHSNTSHFKYLSFFLGSGIIVIFITLSAFASQKGITEKIKNATKKMDPANHVEASIPLPEDIVMADLPYQGGRFYTQTRKDKIKRFKCSACHNNKPVNMANAANISHADININHGEKDNLLSCDTCHNKKERDNLITSKGKSIDIDHVYNLCGQCHFRQKKDWIGGAHGKRITYWAGERVVKNCTSCHNPHSPLLKKRWPTTYSVPLK